MSIRFAGHRILPSAQEIKRIKDSIADQLAWLAEVERLLILETIMGHREAPLIDQVSFSVRGAHTKCASCFAYSTGYLCRDCGRRRSIARGPAWWELDSWWVSLLRKVHERTVL